MFFFFRHTGKVRPRIFMWDSGPSTLNGTLRWDPSVRCKSSNSQLFFKIDVLKYFAIFTGKKLCWNLLLINKTPTQMFSCEYYEIFKSTYLYRTTLVAASGDVSKRVKSDEMKINCLNPASANGCNA